MDGLIILQINFHRCFQARLDNTCSSIILSKEISYEIIDAIDNIRETQDQMRIYAQTFRRNGVQKHTTSSKQWEESKDWNNFLWV